jgi:hypothetical protein
MAQFARPSATTNNPGGWTDQAGGSTNIHQSVDETVADDNDYIQSPLTPSNAVVVMQLSSVTDPVSSSGHTWRYRYGKNASAGDQIDITVEIRQGYVSEGNLGTLIKSNTHTNAGGFPQAGSITLSAGEADSITNYGDLFRRTIANKP